MCCCHVAAVSQQLSTSFVAKDNISNCKAILIANQGRIPSSIFSVETLQSQPNEGEYIFGASLSPTVNRFAASSILT